MTTERSDALFTKWRESTEKFDYFMLAVLGALCAYIAQGYKPVRLGVNPGSVELAALLVLVVAAIAGFRRIESINLTTGLNQRVLNITERRGFLATVLHRGPALNAATGDVHTTESALAETQQLNVVIDELNDEMERTLRSAHRWYRARNVLTLLGFLMLLTGKVWSAYV